MLRFRRRRSLAVTAGLVSPLIALTAGLAPAGPAMAAQAAVSNAPMTQAAGSLALTLAGPATQVRGGDVATTWTADGLQVRAAGAAGSQVSLRRTGAHSAMATASPSSAAAMTPAQYAASGRSVYWDALAVGDSPAQAAKTALALGVALPSGVPAPAGAATVRPNTGIYHSVCTSVGAEPGTYPGGYAVQGSACLVQSYIEQQPGNWYISNEINAHGTSYAGSLGNLTSLRAWDCYCNKYTYYLVQSHPDATIDEGNPTSLTFSVNVPGIGGVSDTVTIYPQQEEPYYPDGSTNGQSYGAVWHGSAYNHTVVADDSLSLIHDGHGTTNNANVSVEIWWNWPV